MRAAASPCSYWRNCQKVSPWPTRRRPWTPCATVTATRSAATRSGGSTEAACSARSRTPAGDAWRRLNTDAPVSIRSQSPERRRNLLDDASHGDALGTAGEADRHAVAQHRRRQREDIVNRRTEPAVDQRPGAAGEHQRLTGARPRSPRDKARHAFGRGTIRPRRANQREDRLDNAFADRDAANGALRRHQLG